MFAKERQDKIYEMIQKNGAVTTSTLTQAFGVSVETIRKDLLNMERKGQLIRVHGGAVAKNDMRPILKLQERNKECSDQKMSLSLKALEFISEGEIIGVDAGSTAISFAEVLKEKFSRLTVVTYSLDVFNILCNHKDFSVILCGGHFMKHENTFYGTLTLDMLNTLHVQKSFIFPSAVSLEYGICDYNKEFYLVQKQLIKSSDDIFILADSSKFEKKALLKVDDMRTDYVFISDSDLPEELRVLYRENNIRIYTGENKKTIVRSK